MNGSGHILIVDDDREIRSLLSRYLAEQGMRVTVAADRKECEAMIVASRPDLVVLDVMLPDGSGLDICRMLRERHPTLAIILLTALKEDVDRIIGLEIGADDYLGKPFNPRELLARIKAILRRMTHAPESPPETRLHVFEGFEADPALRLVRHESGAQLDLTGAEFDLLHVFLERPGRLLSRDQLLDLTQGRNRDPMDRSIDVLMSRLRRKFNEYTETMVFKTVRNGGYQLTVAVRTLAAAR
jgi:two-component system, OmpR family, response regulator